MGVKTDKVRASSGAVGHLVRFSEDGEITTWPVGELALFDINDWRKPANELAVFQAKSEVTEVKAEAEMQSETVDQTQPVIEIVTTQTETIIMEETSQTPAPTFDVESLNAKLASL